MSNKYTAWCTGKYNIQSSLKIIALQTALEYIKNTHRRMSIDDVHLSIVNIDSDIYTVEYTFYFTAFAESYLDIEKLIKKDEDFEVLNVN